MMVNNDFELKKAYHAKQAAYEEMAAARERMYSLRNDQSLKWRTISRLQAEYDSLLKAQEEAWDEYNESQTEYKTAIREKIAMIVECNRLEKDFCKKAENNPKLKEVYEDSVNFFAKLAKDKMVERDDLISNKRSAPRPDNAPAARVLEQLKKARLEHAEVLEKYHYAKNEHNLKYQEFSRLEAKYNALANPEAATEDNSYTSRPQRLENNEKLFMSSGIPEEYWNDAATKQRTDGNIDIYYARSLGENHGHVIIGPDNTTVLFHRKPVLTDDFSVCG